MKNKVLKTVTTVYEAANCEACGAPSHYGELIAVLVPEVIFMGYDSAKIIKHFKQVCPSCYKAKMLKSNKLTSLNDPERLRELLERYKEE